jgi:hypothetical protein
VPEELGRIEKPEAARFEDRRKLYLVPLLFSWQGASEEYVEKLGSYWHQVSEHLANLESKMGTATRIYHESLNLGGDEGLKTLEKLNPPAFQIISDRYQKGAQLEVVEDEELAQESMDWERHLLLGFLSQKVARKVSELFAEASKRRYEHIARIIDENLEKNEVALFFIRENHMVQFPQDIEVFSVSPPMLDEIHRWLRDRSSAAESESDKETQD